MATVNFLYRSTKDKAPLILRLLFRSDNIDYVFSTKTEYEIEKKTWKQIKSKSKDAVIKNKRQVVENDLLEIENFILGAFKTSEEGITKDWLNNQMHLFYNPINENKRSELVTDVIQSIIDTSHLRDNGKDGVGLSQSRISSYKRLSVLFKDFQGKKKYKIPQLDKKVFEAFKRFLLDKHNYSHTYSFKKLADLKTVCKDARSNGIETSAELNDIKTRQVSAYEDDMDVIILTEEEIQQIENVNLTKEVLKNARKWLILACYTGQRGQALTKRINASNFENYGKDLVIKIRQKKGNKAVIIPVLPKVKEIYENGMPHSISTQKLNQYFKEIGKIAEVDTMVLGRKQELVNGKRRGVKKLRPKYEYISTHIGRRTFASNHYGKIPTPIIMRVTGHAKESTFLTYINQTDDSHIEAFLDYYKTKELKERKESNLRVVKKAK